MPLTDIETRICRLVVRRFLDKHEATSRSDLLSAFRASLFVPLQNLKRHFVLTAPAQFSGDESFLPRAVTIHYSRDAEALSLARRSTELVLKATRVLFDRQLDTGKKESLTPQDVFGEAQKTDPNVQQDMIWIGLYLAQEFSVFSMTQPEANQVGIAAFRPTEHIYDVVETDSFWEKHIQEGIKSVEHNRSQDAQNHSVELDDGILAGEIGSEQQASRKVFLVHGNNQKVLREVSEHLKSLNLDVVILYKQPNLGRTVIEKFEKHSDVGFAVVLLTPDDVGAPVSEPQKKANRARQNVILELGYFIAKLGRERVCPLQVGEVELPSDIHGVVYVRYDEGQEWRLKLAEEIDASGIKVDVADVVDKLKSGDYALDKEVDGHRPDRPRSSRRERPSSRRNRSPKTPRPLERQKSWDLWLGFDGAGQNAMLSMQNKGPEPVFNATVKIPEDGSCFKSKPISRADPGGSIYACTPGQIEEIRNALKMAIMRGHIQPKVERLPVRISFTDLGGKQVEFDELEIRLPFTASSFWRRQQTN